MTKKTENTEKKTKTTKKSTVKKTATTKKVTKKIIDDSKPRVLLASAEVNPFSQTGGLGEVASSLPIAVNASGEATMAVVTPLYECVKEEYRKDFEFICHINVPVAWRREYAGLFRYEYRGVIHYFIDNERYFKRPNLYGYYDDAERFAFFNRAVLELMPYSGGLTRNIVQCLEDFGIPLYLSTTVAEIHGKERVEGVTIAQVDENRRVIEETKRYIPCDTLLLSCGLIPENELTREAGIKINPVTSGPEVNQFMQTSCENIFACGNVVHVNDLVDNVTDESLRAGKYAAQYALGTLPKATEIPSVTGNNVRYICPQRICPDAPAKLFFRAAAPKLGVTMKVYADDKEIYSKKLIKINPGEMEHVEVTPEQMQGISAIKIEVI